MAGALTAANDFHYSGCMRHPITAPLSLTVFLALSLAAQAQETASVAAENSPPITAPAIARTHSGELIFKALSLLGVRYKFGGNQPESGFDCSGLMRYLYGEVLGLKLPRRSEQISRLGQEIQREALQPGDLVFFNTLRRTFSHVGLYLGEHRFIHAPARGGQVRIEDMRTLYWEQRFDGARRISAIESETQE